MVGITLKGAKNSQYGRNEVRVQHATGDKVLWPVLATRWIMTAASHIGTSLDEPALSTGGGYGVTAVWVIKVLKALAKSIGLIPANYSSH